MPEIPDDFCSRLPGRSNDRLRAGEVELARLRLDQVPSETFTHSVNPVLLEKTVILRGELIMSGRADKIEPATGTEPVGGAFEPAQKEALKNAGFHSPERKESRLYEACAGRQIQSGLTNDTM